MASQFIQLPQAGGGGGGGGNVVGPSSSGAFDAAIFADTTGKLLADSPLSGHGIFVSPGDGIDQAVSGLGISFKGNAGSTPLNGPGTTGWKVVPVGSNDFLELFVQGVNLLQIRGVGSPPAYTFQNNVNIRPDTAAAGINFGGGANAFNEAFFTKFIFGGTSDGAGGGRNLYLFDNKQSAGGIFPGPGIGMNSDTGSEWYWASVDQTLGVFRENFNLIYNNAITTISAPDNSVADSSPAIGLILKGANKTAGTGNGGGIVLDVGTSVGGTPGTVNIPSIAASSMVLTDTGKNLISGPFIETAPGAGSSFGLQSNNGGHSAVGGGRDFVITDQINNTGASTTLVGSVGGITVSGSQNSLFGSTLANGSPGNISGTHNSGFGYGSFTSLSSGSYNLVFGGSNPSATTLSTGNANILIGFDADVATASTSNTAVIGAYGTTGVGFITDVFLGYGMTVASANMGSLTVHTADAAAGTDQSAASSVLNIAGGRGTGSGAGAPVNIQTAPASSSGATQNTLITGISLSSAGVVTVGPTGATPQHALNVAIATPASGVGTITNLPAGFSGNPTGYAQFTINGVTHVIPFW